jgi:hypothetical protein
MKYQLALQFPAEAITDYDDLIALEDVLMEELGGLADVDEHDCGSGEMNIFIFADEPKIVFEKIKPVLATRKIFAEVVAAYRETDGEDYTILWPPGYNTPFKIT